MDGQTYRQTRFWNPHEENMLARKKKSTQSSKSVVSYQSLYASQEDGDAYYVSKQKNSVLFFWIYIFQSILKKKYLKNNLIISV